MINKFYLKYGFVVNNNEMILENIVKKKTTIIKGGLFIS